MKKAITLIILFITTGAFAQISVKTEYMGNSKFYDAVADTNTGDGSATVYSVGVLAPIWTQAPNEGDPYQRTTAWGIGGNGTFVKMDNHNFPIGKELPSEVMNLGVTVLHLRPLKTRWSMLMALGVGSYTPKNQLSSIQLGENVLANGAVVFIWHWKSNFNIGGGAALNNTFGYPMIFPSFYLKYKGGFSNKFTIDISLLDGAKVAFGYTVHNNLNLKLVTNVGGYAAYLQRNNQKEIFTQQNIITGIQPELKIGKYISIPITAGAIFLRTGRYTKRTLAAMFESEAKNEDGTARSSQFNPAFSFSAGITIGGN